MPTLRAPRDYTLDPAQFSGRPSRVLRFPVRAFTYAAAAVIVVVFGVTFLLLGGSSSDEATSEQSVAQESLEQSEAQSTDIPQTSIAQAQVAQPTQEAAALLPTSTTTTMPTSSPSRTPAPTMTLAPVGQAGAAGPASPPEPPAVAANGAEAAPGTTSNESDLNDNIPLDGTFMQPGDDRLEGRTDVPADELYRDADDFVNEDGEASTAAGGVIAETESSAFAEEEISSDLDMLDEAAASGGERNQRIIILLEPLATAIRAIIEVLLSLFP
jgi:hypothetical protein